MRRFIDDEALFLWLAAPEDCPATAVGFDFDGAPFSHVGTLVTFEVLVRRFALDAVIPDSLGRLIHFLDVGGVLTPEAAGVEAFLQGCGKPLRTMTNCWRQLARCSTAY
ncbi:chromate resistance protein [Klebsiella variicola subsp. variicola]|nr:chromate resistance protein [Klebsiella variicola subsp. variicola]